jgi:hypothetical protein
METWKMKFRYHETGYYFVIMTFEDIFEANRFIKKEEESGNSEFIDYKIIE